MRSRQSGGLYTHWSGALAVEDKLKDGGRRSVDFPPHGARETQLRIAAETSSLAPLEAPNPALSVVAPCYNEQETLNAFCARMLAAARAVCGDSFELILVNDGSRDASWSLVEAQARACPNVVGVNLARNHGHQLAVTAGLSLARGDRVMIIDADLQDPPELLAEMMRRMDEGCDVVYGRRRGRARESRFKLASASLLSASGPDRRSRHPPRHRRLPPHVQAHRGASKRHAGTGPVPARHDRLAGRSPGRTAL
jgi:hypothetical protein